MRQEERRLLKELYEDSSVPLKRFAANPMLRQQVGRCFSGKGGNPAVEYSFVRPRPQIVS